jgi:hypothetical protein
MERKTIILDLTCELIDIIDRINTMDDRSLFISELLEKQLDQYTSSKMEASTDLSKKLDEREGFFGVSGEISLINSSGISLGKFDINTLEGFENLTKKIQEISNDPAVQIRARTLF